MPCEIPTPVHSYRKQLHAAHINQRHLPPYPPHLNNTRQGGEIKLLLPTNPVSLGGASHGRGNYFLDADANLPPAALGRKTPRQGSVRNVKTTEGGERNHSPHPKDYSRRAVRNTHRGRQMLRQGEGRGRRKSRNEGGDIVGDAMYQKMLGWAGTLAVLRVCMCVMLCTAAV